MLKFTESITVELPKLTDDVIKEYSLDDRSPGYVVEIAAIHEGLTANFTKYTKDELSASVTSWVEPYAKPVITNHDTHSEPIGRIMAARNGSDDGRFCLFLQAGIGDADAVEKFKDKRYLTGSVGGSVESAICTICGADWAKPTDDYSLPCEHRRGRTYDDRIAALEMRGITWREYSMVNVPADSSSGVRDSEDSVGWVRAKVFAFDSGNESIVELNDDGVTSVVEGAKSNKTGMIYHNVRGAFLSALLVEQDVLDKETEVSEENDSFEDLLAIYESKEEDSDSEDAEAEEVEVEDPEELGEGVEDDATDEDNESGEEDEESDESDTTEDEDDVEDKQEESDEEEDAEADTELVDSEESDEDQERIVALESRVAELEATNENLESVVSRLTAALKRALAEKVVEAKIDRGLLSESDYADHVENHVGRSVSSLTDTLSDLAKMPKTIGENEEIVDLDKISSPSSKALGEDDEKSLTISEEESVEPELAKVDVLESILTDTLMGRRKL